MDKTSGASGNVDIVSIPGVRFSPDRVELIKFLYIMANGGQLPPYIPIKEYIDVYEDGQIWELMEEQEELYCFMKLKNKTSKSSRINRVTQRGTWKGQSGEKIYNGNDQVGLYRNFSFVPKKGVRKKNRMVMHEYQLDGVFKTLHSGYVIVHIKKYAEKDAKVSQHEDEKVLIPIQPSQPPLHQHQDEQSHFQQYAPEMHPFFDGAEWEELGLSAADKDRFALEMHPFFSGPEWEDLGFLADGDNGSIDQFLNMDTPTDADATTDLFMPLPLPLQLHES